MNVNAHIVDGSRTRCLCDVGSPGYLAVTAVAADGTEHLVLAESDSLGEGGARYDAACSDVAHEQAGPLPLEYVRRVTIAARINRCGRLTQAGRPCRIRVAVVGAACEWHRSRTDA
jgi:hypothetical protein